MASVVAGNSVSEKARPADWEGALGKPGRACAVSGQEFAVGDEYISTLELTEEGLGRRDYHPDHFETDRPEVFAYWRARVPEDEDQKRRPLDINFLVDFFRRLQAQPDTGQVEVAYIVSLLLIRKKVLLLEDTRAETNEEGESVELMQLKFAKDEDAESFTLVVPELSEEKMEAIRGDLGRIFNLGDS